MTVAEYLGVALPLLAFTGLIVGVQTFWIARSLDRIDARLDRFEDQMHRDLQAHTEAIAELRARDR
jgi:hypothetical protein